MFEEIRRKPMPRHGAFDDECRRLEAVTRRIEAAGLDLTATEADWYKVGFALNNLLGESGRAYFHRLSRFYPEYDEAAADKKYSVLMRERGSGTPITIATLYWMAQQAGIDTAAEGDALNGFQPIAPPPAAPAKPAAVEQPAPDYWDYEALTPYFDRERLRYNLLFLWVMNVFDLDSAKWVFDRYSVGSCDCAAVFIQHDGRGVRAVKVQEYLPNGHRAKARPPYFVKPRDGFHQVECLFGAHLVTKDTKQVHIVESEKTAMYCSIWQPNKIWLATGGKGKLRLSNCECLRGLDVVLYPDLQAEADWAKMAKELETICRSVTISDLCRKFATPDEVERKCDLADVLERLVYCDREQAFAEAEARAAATATPAPEPAPAAAAAPADTPEPKEPPMRAPYAPGKFINDWDYI